MQLVHNKTTKTAMCSCGDFIRTSTQNSTHCATDKLSSLVHRIHLCTRNWCVVLLNLCCIASTNAHSECDVPLRKAFPVKGLVIFNQRKQLQIVFVENYETGQSEQEEVSAWRSSQEPIHYKVSSRHSKTTDFYIQTHSCHLAHFFILYKNIKNNEPPAFVHIGI